MAIDEPGHSSEWRPESSCPDTYARFLLQKARDRQIFAESNKGKLGSRPNLACTSAFHSFVMDELIHKAELSEQDMHAILDRLYAEKQRYAIRKRLYAVWIQIYPLFRMIESVVIPPEQRHFFPTAASEAWKVECSYDDILGIIALLQDILQEMHGS